MPDSIRKVEYFSIQVPNRPGEAFRVLQTIVSSGINLLACSGHSVGRRAQIDVVPDDTRSFEAAASQARLRFTATRGGFLSRAKTGRAPSHRTCADWRMRASM